MILFINVTKRVYPKFVLFKFHYFITLPLHLSINLWWDRH